MEINLAECLKKNKTISQNDLETIEINYGGNLSMERLWRLVLHQYHRIDVYRNRERTNVEIRQMFYFMSQYLHPRESLSDIGKFAGGYDHATVLHGRKTIQNLSSYDQRIKEIIKNIKKKINKI